MSGWSFDVSTNVRPWQKSHGNECPWERMSVHRLSGLLKSQYYKPKLIVEITHCHHYSWPRTRRPRRLSRQGYSLRRLLKSHSVIITVGRTSHNGLLNSHSVIIAVGLVPGDQGVCPGKVTA